MSTSQTQSASVITSGISPSSAALTTMRTDSLAGENERAKILNFFSAMKQALQQSSHGLTSSNFRITWDCSTSAWNNKLLAPETLKKLYYHITQTSNNFNDILRRANIVKTRAQATAEGRTSSYLVNNWTA